MPSFPVLKSGAVAQYPLQFTLRSQTERVEFLDGSSQQFRILPSLRRWKLSLSQLDEQELDRIIDFVEQQEGAVFSFNDPATGNVVPSCVISQRGLVVTAVDELTNSAELVIEEVA